MCALITLPPSPPFSVSKPPPAHFCERKSEGEDELYRSALALSFALVHQPWPWPSARTEAKATNTNTNTIKFASRAIAASPPSVQSFVAPPPSPRQGSRPPVGRRPPAPPPAAPVQQERDLGPTAPSRGYRSSPSPPTARCAPRPRRTGACPRCARGRSSFQGLTRALSNSPFSDSGAAVAPLVVQVCDSPCQRAPALPRLELTLRQMCVTPGGCPQR